MLVLLNSVFKADKNVAFKSVNMSPLNDYQEYSINKDNFDMAFSVFWNDGLSHTKEKSELYRYVTLSFTELDLFYK